MRLMSFLPSGGMGKIHASSIDNASQSYLSSATSVLKRWHWKQPTSKPADDVQDEAMAFTMALVALAAHLSTKVARPQDVFYSDFLRIFPIPNGERAKSWALFQQALRSETPTLFYARQLASLFPTHASIHADAVLRMLQLATCDEQLSTDSYHFIMDLADACHISDVEIQRLFTVALVPSNEREAMRWLHVDKMTSLQALKQRYRHEMQAYHPDRLAQFARAHTRDNLLAPILAHRASMLNAAYKSLLPHHAA